MDSEFQEFMNKLEILRHLIKPREVAEILSINLKTVNELIEEGKLVSVTLLPRTRRIITDSLISYLWLVYRQDLSKPRATEKIIQILAQYKIIADKRKPPPIGPSDLPPGKQPPQVS